MNFFVATQRIESGLKARDMIARAEGPGNPSSTLFRGLKGRNNLSVSICVSHVPPLQGGFDLFGIVFPGLRASRSTPGYHIAGFQP